MNLQAVVLAVARQRLGKELAPEWCAGGLCVVANRPLALHVADQLKAAGARRVLLVTDRGSGPALESHDGGARVERLEVSTDRGELAALTAALAHLDPGPVLVHAGDGLLARGLYDTVQRFQTAVPDVLVVNPPVPVSVGPLGSGVVVLREPAPPEPIALVLSAAGRDAVAAAEADSFAGEGLARLPAAVAAAGGCVETIDTPAGWRFGGSCESLLVANEMLLDELPNAVCAPRPDVELHGRVSIDPTARVSRSTLRGPVVVGADARIEDAYVGPYTSIGDRATIDGCEIERSIVMAGAQLRFVGSRIEDSVIGREVQVSRSFTRPNALRLHLAPQSRISLN